MKVVTCLLEKSSVLSYILLPSTRTFESNQIRKKKSLTQFVNYGLLFYNKTNLIDSIIDSRCWPEFYYVVGWSGRPTRSFGSFSVDSKQSELLTPHPWSRVYVHLYRVSVPASVHFDPPLSRPLPPLRRTVTRRNTSIPNESDLQLSTPYGTVIIPFVRLLKHLEGYTIVTPL